MVHEKKLALFILLLAFSFCQIHEVVVKKAVSPLRGHRKILFKKEITLYESLGTRHQQ